MPPPPCHNDDPPPMASEHPGLAGDTGTPDHAGPLPVGWERRQLSPRPALVAPPSCRGRCCCGRAFGTLGPVRRSPPASLVMQSSSRQPARPPRASSGASPAGTASRCPAWPSSRSPGSAASHGGRVRGASSRASAGTPQRLRARPTRLPSRPQGHRPHGVLDVRRAASPPQAAAPLPPALGRSTARLPALLHLIAPGLTGTSRGLEGALWPPPRPADGAPGRLTPHVDAAGRGGAVLPLSWALCGARSPSHVWPHGG